MERGDKNISSHGKGSKNEKDQNEVNNILSDSVNKTKFVNKMLTKSGSSKSKLQRVDLNTFRRIDEIKKRYQRRSFNDTLEFLLNCYDFLEGIAIRYNLGDIKSATEFIENHLPKSQAEVIHQNVFDLIKKTGINGEDAEVLIDHFLQTLILVKLRRKRAIEVLRPFLVVRGGSP